MRFFNAFVSVFRVFPLLSFFLIDFTAEICESKEAEKAKNVILFIGDGMGFNCDLAGTYYRYGEAGKQPYHSFPVLLGCTTFARAQAEKEIPSNVKGYDPAVFWETLGNGSQGTEFTVTTDSAAASTALHGGVKTVRAESVSMPG